MSEHRTRYDALRNRIRRRHSRSKTYEPADSLVFDVDDHENVGNDSFLEHGPFNHVYVENDSAEALTVYTRKNRESYVVIPAGESAHITDEVAARYIGFLRLDGTFSEGDVTVQAGVEVDSEELRLLEMSGMLDIQG